MSSFSLLENKLNTWSVSMSKAQMDQFELYYDLLIDWNSKMNLTAITDRDEVEVKHFIDSAAIASVIDMNSVSSMADIGTGAGFPGIPVKILFPHIDILLVDSLNKRVSFLNTVINELGLSGINAVHGRAENVSRESKYREYFDLCVSRAVANLASLTELCLPFVRVGGRFISYKSGNYEEEVSNAGNAISLLGGMLSSVIDLSIENSSRSFIIVDKVANIVDKYPRREGIPLKKPL